MRDKDDFGLPEQRASTGLPLSVMLVSMLTIVVYLLVGGAFSNNGSGVVAVYVPQQTDAEHR
ncbi:hypothetical protein GOL41_17205 [Sinorhizobium medicae]|uniref:hypothetical protein n=1 Tax=Sinorhizobium medicae TaxID=110321 RepID=UPI0012976B70|nr:hypothetical protein [Sinorhizobium medicae]MDX0438883.1 hypothetical protein [Sinorhizobium medicae]MDX0631840.1 hypothetical protein [Sinorhizobium medicae]MDX0900619.1 hypothetical protein [Sinorhizobium medicae]MDX0955684.1 hypothetical protein [Sinorhizobium medicae]MDX0965387.1 hypothetical protein [Sinorhizobium medicae]